MTQKKSRLLSTIQLLFLSQLAFSILRAPANACSYAALALQLWFEKMIPSLFPFMVLSGMIVRLDFGRTISSPVYPLIGRLYRISKNACTTLICGFLFGFPLGAKTVAEQYSLGQLSKPQAQYLLSFCNNIGPVYLLSFALPLLGLSVDPSVGSANVMLRNAVIAAFFDIPLLYGLALRYTAYRNIDLSVDPRETATALLRSPDLKISSPKTKTTSGAPLSAASSPKPTFSSNIISVPKQPLPPGTASAPKPAFSFISALDASVTSACGAITRLGGYMVFFMVCNLLLEKTPLFPRLAALLEITSGLALAKDTLSPALFMTMLTFGGLSCFAQTYTCIRDTDLSFGNYCVHKFLQTSIAFCLYTLLFYALRFSAV